MMVAMGILLNISRQTVPVFRAGAVPDPERRTPAGKPPARETPVKLAPGPSGRTRR
jgi:hypothetical protein